MTWNWFDQAFPWIGGVAAVVLMVLMFGTSSLRGDPTVSRWRDRVWISWMATVVYLLHNVEEYGIDLLGRTHSFPHALCENLKQPPYPDCLIPPAFYLAVNVPLFWVVGPLAALLSRHHRLVGFALYGVIAVNSLVHIGASMAKGEPYNPGLLTAAVLFVPFTVWVGCAFFGAGRLSYKVWALLVFCGVITHVFLIGPMVLFINGRISATVLISSQVFNGALAFVIPWLAGKFVQPAAKA